MLKYKTILFILFFLFSTACALLNPQTPTTQIVLSPSPESEIQVILQRLEITYLGLDGHKVVGSGCPGNDRKGSIENIHFLVRGVNVDKKVQRVLVVGNYSTLTWATPCTDSWGLLAKDTGNGIWDIFIAPSLFPEIYTIIFFYDDNSMALGMLEVPQR